MLIFFVLVIDASLGLWIGNKVIELLIHSFVMSNANTRCTPFTKKENKGA